MKAKKLLKISVYFLIFVVVIVIFSVLTGEETKQTYAEKVFSSWDGSSRALVDCVKVAMHNPGSFKHVKTEVGQLEDSSFVVVMTYQGTNAYGAVVTEMIQAKIDTSGVIIGLQPK